MHGSYFTSWHGDKRVTILVTGGTGFLGKAIISEFIRGSKQLTVVARKETLIENQFIKNFQSRIYR